MYRKVIFPVILLFTLITLVLPQTIVKADDTRYGAIVEKSITLKNSSFSLGQNWNYKTQYNFSTPNSYVYGNQEYVGVGDFGSVMKSKDGLNWSGLSKFKNYQLSCIAWNGKNYVLFGDNSLYPDYSYSTPSQAFVSTDAVTWNKVNVSFNEPIFTVVWGKDKFIAAGQDYIYTSKDGVVWSKTPTPVKIDDYWEYAKYENNTFIIKTEDGKNILVSKDGVHWTYKSNPALFISDIVWVKNHFVGAGDGIYTSTDGLNWKKASGVNDFLLSAIAYDGNKAVAVGLNGMSTVVMTSTDGVKWSTYTVSNLPINIPYLYPVNGGFAGVGTSYNTGDSTYSIFTKDGIHWSIKLAGVSDVGMLNSVATNGKRTVAVGSFGAIIYTDDGTNWNSSNFILSNPTLGAVTWNGSMFVAVGKGAYYSKDGISWSKASVKGYNDYLYFDTLIWTGKFFLASGQVSGTYISKDGTTWTPVSSLSDPSYWNTSMVWDGKRVLAAVQVVNFDNGNTDVKLMQSVDGTKWSLVKDFKQQGQFHLTWSGKGYVAVDVDSNASKYVWTSKDGLNWSKGKMNLTQIERFNFLTSFDGNFFGYSDTKLDAKQQRVNYDAYYLSKDGINWREIPIPKRYPDDSTHRGVLNDGVKANGKYIFVGGYGDVMDTTKLSLLP